jgi:hypothetical protein
VRQALDVVGQVSGQVEHRGAEAGVHAHARLDEPLLDEGGEGLGRDLLQPHDGARFVERPLRAEHGLHQRGLRAGEDVAHLALVLHRGAQRLFDAAAVEAADRLELVERHDDPAAARVGETGGQREHLGREARDVARGADGGEGDRHAEVPSGVDSMRTSGRVAPIASRSQLTALDQRVSADRMARA